MARKAMIVQKQDEEVALAMKRMDAQVREGFEAIGVEGDALREAMAFHSFGRMHFNDMRHYIGGGMAKLYADLMAEIKAVRQEINETEANEVELQRMLREDRSRLVKHVIDVYDRCREAALTAAIIESKKQEKKEKVKTKKAPAFPVLVNVSGNAEIKTNEKAIDVKAEGSTKA